MGGIFAGEASDLCDRRGSAQAMRVGGEVLETAGLQHQRTGRERVGHAVAERTLNGKGRR
ncbi:hypothetical protein D3867_00015 [Azospirillum argentinense]|uniref:Uncharacterized protein n=1 Tax=Azospirillum brasilense TaxID=192 RepID=A0A4D8PQ66_AZOBR|nr:hypothetical protein D3867_00015 [Azospirillum argentinense]